MIAVVQIVIFTAYVIYVWRKVGIQKSISESFYTLEKYNEQYLFTIVLSIIGILQCEIANNYAFFLSGCGLCFAGLVATFKSSKYNNFVHFSGAFLAILGSLVGYWLEGTQYPFFIVLSSLLPFIIIKFNYKIWWFEIFCFYLIIIFKLI